MNELSVYYTSHTQFTGERFYNEFHDRVLVLYSDTTKLQRYKGDSLEFIIDRDVNIAERCFLPKTALQVKKILFSELKASLAARYQQELTKFVQFRSVELDNDTLKLIYTPFGQMLFGACPEKKVSEFIAALRERGRAQEILKYNYVDEQLTQFAQGKQLEDELLELRNKRLHVPFEVSPEHARLLSISEDLTVEGLRESLRTIQLN